jgi:hypothetical protein
LLHPERAIADADAVFGYGRCVLEGLACGRAAFVLDHRGADDWVDQQSYARMESDGFAGLVEPRELDEDQLRRAIERYDPRLGAQGRKLVAVHHNAFAHAARVSEILKQLPTPPEMESSAALELARLSRLQWESEWRCSVLLDDVADLQVRSQYHEERARAYQERATKAEQLLRSAEERERASIERLEALTATRRYRLSAGMARPLDRLRRRRHSGEADQPM